MYLLSLGVNFEQKDIAFGGDEWKAYKAELSKSGKNPSGHLPVYEDGDITLSESNAIMRYVAAKHHKECKDAKCNAVSDMLLDKIIPLRDSCISCALSGDDNLKAKHKETRSKHYEILNSLLKTHVNTSSGLVGGDHLMPCDCSIFACIQDDARLFGKIEGHYEALEKLLCAAANHPVIHEWGKEKEYLPYACCEQCKA